MVYVTYSQMVQKVIYAYISFIYVYIVYIIVQNYIHVIFKFTYTYFGGRVRTYIKMYKVLGNDVICRLANF